MYKRVLLKISGEQLSGRHQVGIDPKVGHYLARECQKATEAGCQLALVAGGGNMIRGARIAGNGISRVTADQMGMISCLINAIALTDIFVSDGLDACCMSNIFAEQVAESYSFHKAEQYLEKGRIVLIAGGIGRPYITTDTAAVNLALELSCEVMLKATKVEGVHDKDPHEFNKAVLIKKITHQEVMGNNHINVMDRAALALAMEHKIPIIVFDPLQQGNIIKAVSGEKVGSYIG